MTSRRGRTRTIPASAHARWRAPLAVLALAGVCAAAGASAASAQTTLEQRIVGDPDARFSFLDPASGEPYVVRQELAPAQSGRGTRRTSLSYFGQLSDFQLADEESPARVEFFDSDPFVRFSNSGHRPQEALVPHQVESAIRRMNQYVTSPTPQGDGSRAEMALAILTGDLADSNQKNEVEWVRTLMDGGTLDPNSGQPKRDPVCAGLPLDDPRNYTGVQDYDDYAETRLFWDPDRPAGIYKEWPVFPGLMDHAQDPFNAKGLEVPSYVAMGNHDVLVQGNEDANQAYERVALGCIKPIGPFPNNQRMEDTLNSNYLQGLLNSDPEKVAQVPADSRRRYVDKPQYKRIFQESPQADAHGFDHVAPRENRLSNKTASYYSFSPQPGVRFIALDSNSAGSGFLVAPSPDGGVSDTSNGNVDDPQFRWLKRELQRAGDAGELVVTFAHHAIGSMNYTVADELALPCTAQDAHGHDVNPGCDRDPRLSTPVHDGQDVAELFLKFPVHIAHVAGHSHNHQITPFERADGSGGFWEIKTSALADWPPQSRVIEVMDNRDGTLSLVSTVLDTDAPIDPPGGPPAGFDVQAMASLARVITYNDPQAGPGAAEGNPRDRNVELLLPDPR